LDGRAVKLVLIVASAIVVGSGVTAAGYAVADDGRAAEPRPLGPGTVTVVVDIEYSRFEPASLRVAAGTTVRFVVSNHDPISHEFIVGPPDVHRRHRNGTEPRHDPKPGEISLGPDEQGVTTYVFDEPGVTDMACHLPGHYDYGMHGEIEVIA
jgi:uncharacterized cupredoxin-like copper-binding protein